jgi:cytochrome b
MTTLEITSHRVWDRWVRAFHWINFLSVLLLIIIGLIIFNGKALGLAPEAKMALKTCHVWIGYLFVLNLLWRLVWGFLGSRHGRWSALLNCSPSEMKAYLHSLSTGNPRVYLGHNPLGRLMVLALLLLLITMAVTGLMLASTDLLMPPLGHWIANWIAAPGVDPGTLIPGNKAMFDAVAWDAMRAFRQPFKTLHVYAFYALCGLIPVHILAVVIAELKERSGLVSAMIHGYKYSQKQPVELEDASEHGRKTG